MAKEIQVQQVAGFFKEGWSLQRFITKVDHLGKLRGDAHQVLTTIFKGTYPELPIRGGWGYSQKDAVIIDRNHPAAERPFHGVGVEYLFAQLRMYLELITVKPDGQTHAQCKYQVRKQSLVRGKEGKVFDVLHCDITALPEADFRALKAEWEGPGGISSLYFDEDAHNRKRDAAMVHYQRDYWFEISSFYGKTFDDEAQYRVDPSQIELPSTTWKPLSNPLDGGV